MSVPIDMSPLFKSVQVVATLDLTQTAPIEQTSFQELLAEHQEHHIPFAIALIKDISEERIYPFYAPAILMSLNRRQTNPLTRQEIDKIHWFVMSQFEQPKLDYISTTYAHNLENIRPIVEACDLQRENPAQTLLAVGDLLPKQASNWYTLALHHDSREAHFKLGCYYLEHNDKEKAIEHFQQSGCIKSKLKLLEINPHEPIEFVYSVFSEAENNSLQEVVTEALVERLSKEKDPRAQYCLGKCYDYGWAAPQSHKYAARHYRYAASEGNARAQNNLGLCYLAGEGVEKDDLEGVKWLTLAAKQGHSGAQVQLGQCYLQARGVKQSPIQAVSWFRKAAEQGNKRGQMALGACYHCGDGVNQSFTEGAKWTRLAAEQGEANAQYNLGLFYWQGEGVDQSDIEAAKWFRKAAEQEFSDAQYMLSGFYYLGKGVDKSNSESLKWIRKAAEQGHPGAKVELGYYYFRGTEVEQSLEEAVKWFSDAAEQGDPLGQYCLGLCYASGQGIRRSLSLAKKWLNQAKEQGLQEAEIQLAELNLAEPDEKRIRVE